jgi:hypothetical protein
LRAKGGDREGGRIKTLRKTIGQDEAKLLGNEFLKECRISSSRKLVGKAQGRQIMVTGFDEAERH